MVNRRKNARKRGNKDQSGDRWGGLGAPAFGGGAAREWGPYIRTALLVMVLPVIVLQGYRYFSSTSHFVVKEVVIHGMDRLDETAVLEFLGIERGMALSELEETKLAEDLIRHPRVRTAEVRVDLPNKLHIWLEERAAAAVVVLDSLFLADGKGTVFKPVGPNDDIEGLPLVTGISRERLDDEATAPGEQVVVREAIALAIAYASHPVAKAQGLGELNHDPLFGWTLITEKDALEVRLGSGQVGEKLDRLEHILRDLEARGAMADVVRLDSVRDPHRVAVRMRYVEQEGEVDQEIGVKATQVEAGEPRRPPAIHKKIPPMRVERRKKPQKSSKLDEILGD